jgi:hypothetical protein
MWEGPLRPDSSAILWWEQSGRKGLSHIQAYDLGLRMRFDGTHSSHFASYSV